MARRRGPRTRYERDRAGGSGATGAYDTPPPGTFDPGMEAQRRQSRRGLADQVFDTERADRLAGADLERLLRMNTRGAKRTMFDLRTDKGRGLHDINLDRDRGVEDIGTRRGDVERDFARDLEDLALAEQRGGEDYARAVAGLQRKYATMASVQEQGAALAGQSATRGGFAAQSAEKRAGNESFERTPIDTARQRQLADIGTRRTRGGENRALALGALDTRQGRLLEDVGTSKGRLRADFGTARGRTRQDLRSANTVAKMAAQRSGRDRALSLSRATREQGFYEQDVTQQEYYQAHQTDPTIKFPTLADIRRRRRR